MNSVRNCLVIICLLLTACEKSLDRSAYIQWVKDYQNGLHAKKTFSDFVFDVQYQPSQYVSLLNNGVPQKEKDPVEYYTLKINLTGTQSDIIGYNVANNSEKQRKQYYFSYLFQQDIYIEQGGKRIPCVLYHFEPGTLNKARTFVLGFERTENSEFSKDVNFVIDSHYFSSLPIKIKITRENLPTLKI